MKDYTAQGTDLSVKIKILSGEEKTLRGPTKLSAKKALTIIKEWQKYVEDNTRKGEIIELLKKDLIEAEKSDDIDKIKDLKVRIEAIKFDEGPMMLARQLVVVYNDTTAGWFLENLDMATLNDLLMEVASEVAKLKND